MAFHGDRFINIGKYLSHGFIGTMPRQEPTSEYRKLLESGEFSDVCVIVRTKNDETIFKCHKLILASHSGYFKRIFFGSDGGGAPAHTAEVFLDDQDTTDFRQLLNFIYGATYLLSDESERDIESHARMLCLGAKFDVEKLRFEAMSRLTWWIEHLLIPYPENKAANLAEGLDELAVTEDKRKKDFRALDIVYSNTTKRDRSLMFMEPIAHHLHWLIEPDEGALLEQFADKHSDFGFELAMAFQEDLSMGRHSKQWYKSDPNRPGSRPGSWCQSCKRLTFSKAVCDECGKAVKHVGCKVSTECEKCEGVPDFISIVCGGCGEEKEVLDKRNWDKNEHHSPQDDVEMDQDEED